MQTPTKMSRATELYDISTRLAVGDACLVYKATDRTSGRTVALKLLLPEGQITHPLDADSLLRDAPDIAHLAGVNIVQLLDAFADEDGTVLVYEFAEGTRGLDVPSRCPIPAAHAVDVAAQLLGALRSGERQRYPHGDLKPSDVSLVRLDHGRPLVMVLDWGLANYRSEPTPGALAFTAPERLAGDPPSHEADLFSAGAVLFYLFTGRPLVEGTTKDDFAAAWQYANPAALGALRPDLPTALVKWIVRLLQPDASQRPPSAVEALTALAALNPPLPPVVPENIRPRPAHPQQQQPQPSSVVPVAEVDPSAPASAIFSAEEARKDLARIQKKKQSLGVFTTYFIMILTLGAGAVVVWRKSQAAKNRDLAETPEPSTPTPSFPPRASAPAVPEEPPPARPHVAPPQPPPATVAAPSKSPAPAPTSLPRATFSSSATPPAVDSTDVANLAAQTGTDKWFFGERDERYGADAAKGLTFTTGGVPVLFKALTYKIADSNKKGATSANPTTWTIRLGTLSGNNFTQLASEQAEQTADTGNGHFITWTFTTPVPLAANTTYAVDVAMRSRTPYPTGIPYLSCSKSVTTPGVGVSYASGDRGVGAPTIAPSAGIARVFHVALQAR